MKKDELIRTIQVEHRQLERYLFYFEKNTEGEFVAGDRSKFGTEEMQQPGVCGEWSLKDLLSQVIYWEQRFLRLCHGKVKIEMTADLPLPELHWDEIIPKESTDFDHFRSQSVQSVLKEMKDSYEQVISTVEAISDEMLFTPGKYAWTGEASIADYVALFTYRHYDWLKGLVRHWRKSHAGKYLNKKIIMDRIQTEHERLRQIIKQLTNEQMNSSGVVGKWSVKDILAHLMNWEQRFIDWYQDGVCGEVPETPAPGIGWNQLDLLNQRIYEKYCDWPIENVLREFNASYSQILAIVENIPEEEMFAAGRYSWLGENSMVDVILANTANHYRWAKRHIRKWLKAIDEL